MSNIYKSLNEYIKDFESELKRVTPKKSGKLRNSVDVKLIEKGTEDFNIEISMFDYGYYQDEGVNGTEKKWGSRFSFKKLKPPAGSFAPYTNSISGRFAISSYVYKHGIKPKNFIEPAITKAEKNILDKTSFDISEYIEKKWKEL
jgi:hypothetical protein